METENNVALHGLWSSTYTKRVELALKIKGIPFEYVEEDLLNKSPLLLKHNPVHKKVPVLVHNGKPIAESLVILEYIDEMWKNEPRLLPEDPYKRAEIRFWAGYIQQLLESGVGLFTAEGEEAHDGARQDMFDKLDVLEEGMKSLDPRSKRDTMDLLDIMIVATLGPFRAQEEFLGIKILDPEEHTLIFQWVANLIELPVVKEIMPPHDVLVSLLQKFTQFAKKFPVDRDYEILYQTVFSLLSEIIESVSGIDGLWL